MPIPRSCGNACALLLLAAAVATDAQAQLTQQGSKLVGSGAVGGDSHQGSAVAISADGNTAVVGGEQDSGFIGAVWVFVRTGETWTQQGAKLVGTGAVGTSVQGHSASLSADGNTLLVGGSNDDGGNGAAWVFVRSGGAWTQPGSKLVGAGASGKAQQGTSVALSADGSTAMIGGPADSSGVGACWVFVRTGDTWTQQGPKLIADDPVNGGRQGAAVSISRDGNTAIVGGASPLTGSAVAWFFVRDGSGWHQQGNGLIGSEATGTGGNGPSVSLSADGNTALVGSLANSGGGATWVYVRSGGVWSQEGPRLLGSGAVGSASQGWSVALSANGSTALVGGVNDASVRGAAWVFGRNGSTWLQQGPKLVGAESVIQSRQGWSVALSEDGSTGIVGGPGDGGGPGAAWIYGRSLRIVSARDLPNDQGGRLRIVWQRSCLDSVGLGADQITSYGIWRRIPPAEAVARRAASPARSMNDSLGTAYDFVLSIPAVQSPSYNVVVPTLADSSASGTARFTFLVTAHTSNPSLYYTSAPDSGYSVDNLAPPRPATFTATSVSGTMHLHWSPSVAADLAGYRLYRGADPSFVADAASLLATLADTGYVDAAPIGMSYKLSAVDVHGNESTFAVLGPTTEVTPDGEPIAFGLSGVVPNPNPGFGMHALFTLARSEPARLELFDASGRRCVTREVGSLGPGRHDVTLAERSPLAPGLYLLRLTQGASARMVRVAVVK